MPLDGIREAVELIQRAHRVVALTGAGISAESGIPTFRGAGGLWRMFRAEDLATPEAFARDPQLVWEWYDWRRQLIAKAHPNPGHAALAEFSRTHREFRLVTQNVDGLHERAGSENVIKLHGDIWTLRCTRCPSEWTDLTAPLKELPPRCGRCGAMARPGVVWFGEGLPEAQWTAAQQAVNNADLVLVIGTSAAVYPAASLIPMARLRRAKVIEVNVAETTASQYADIALRGPSGEILPQLLGT